MKKEFILSSIKMLFVTLTVLTISSCSDDEEYLTVENVNSGQEEIKTDDLSSKGSCKTRKVAYSGNGSDVNAKVSKTIDDRSCAYNYTQTKNGTSHTWGSYRLKANNSSDNLQTRIERASSTVSRTKIGNYIEIAGTVRILRACEFPKETRALGKMENRDGTYFIQAKGKHTGGGGSPDPAICLFIAKPIKVKGNDYYNIYREEIKYRGGGSKGRKLTYITRVRKNRDFYVKIKTGFSKHKGKKRHYVNSSINGVFKSFTVPDPGRATQAKLRMGAYRCKGGEARILWRNVTSKIVNKK